MIVAVAEEPKPEEGAEEEEKKVEDTEEETKQDLPFISNDILSHQYFNCINEENGEGELTPEKVSIYILASLEKINGSYFKQFGLD
jgi:hypothetical protein